MVAKGSSILQAFRRPEVDFDPQNPEHLEAFRMLCLGKVDDKIGILCKQHPTLRFKVEHPYEDVRSMMFHKVGEAFVSAKVA